MEPNQETTMDALTETEVLPDVQPHSIEAIREEKAQVKIENAFNPEIHAQNPDGSPKKNKDGTFALKRGRKSGSKNNSVLNVPSSENRMEGSSSLGSATIVSSVLEQLQIKLISEDFTYSETERKTNVELWVKTFDYYGGVKLTPPQELALQHAGIIAARAAQERTRNKFELFGAWFKNKIGGIKFKRNEGKKNALLDNRTDELGQDDIRNEKSGVTKKARN